MERINKESISEILSEKSARQGLHVLKKVLIFAKKY
jgi:hypothetical protein